MSAPGTSPDTLSGISLARVAPPSSTTSLPSPKPTVPAKPLNHSTLRTRLLARADDAKAGEAGYIAVTLLVAATISGRALITNAIIGLVAVIGLISLCSKLWIHRTAFYTLPFLLYWILLGVAVGSMPHTGSALFQWLNGDGRMLVAVLPLLVIGTMRVTRADLRLFINAVQVIVWFNVGLLILALAGTPGLHKIVLHRHNFFGLTSSHHAAGFLMSGAMLILIAARRSGITTRKPAVVTIVAAVLLIVATGSRTSIIGLAGVALWMFFSRRRFSDALRVIGVTIVLAVLVLALSSRFSSTIAEFFSQDFRTEAATVFSAGYHSDQSAHYQALYGSQAGYVANILARFWYWGIAVGLWLKSPFFGIGSFRYNDIQLQFTGWPHIADFATSGIDNSAQLAGAHDQFFGTLVENGILGLVLLLLMWLVPYRIVRRNRELPQALRDSACQMVPFGFATGLTGYTMASPSLTFICLTWLALVALLSAHSPGTRTGRPGLARRVRPKQRLASAVAATQG